MKTRQSRFFCCDFETTVYAGQVNTEVWAAACVEFYTEDVRIFHSIEEQFEYFKSLRCNVVCYYHNLKFDGAFWLSYLMADLGYKQAAVKISTGTDDFSDEDPANDFKFLAPWDMKAKTFQYSISDMGQWYKILIKYDKEHFIEIRDSLKLLPFSVAAIGTSFKTKHQKLDMEYTGFRYAGCEITPDEQKYISNDVLVIKEAMEIMFEEDHKKLTIGSCCLDEYKKTISHAEYDENFPDLYKYKLDKSIYGSENIGKYIRKAYRGGWCYVARGKERKIFHDGTTADVNSLYPSMMHSESGNVYPVGTPTFWKGDGIPTEALACDKYYFIRCKTRFYLKPGKLPFIQLKHTLMYMPNECLESSDLYDDEEDEDGNPVLGPDGKPKQVRCTHYIDFDGSTKPATVEMTLSCTDFELIKAHYDLYDFEILDGCYFNTAIGIFDEYINKYRKMKQESTGARRQLAKLMLNNLYGKTAASPDSSFKVAYLKEDKSIGFYCVEAADKQPGYIPVGAAITSYARNFTIRAAQANYHGPDKPGFIYADTDSIHCDLRPDQITGITVHPSNFCCWKLESCWDIGYFVRQKTYIEHVTEEDQEPIENPYYNIKCAGMPEHCKDLFLMSMGENVKVKDLTEEERKFVETPRKITDFVPGLVIPGKLLPKRIRGGVLLVETNYEMR